MVGPLYLFPGAHCVAVCGRLSHYRIISQDPDCQLSLTINLHICADASVIIISIR